MEKAEEEVRKSNRSSSDGDSSKGNTTATVPKPRPPAPPTFASRLKQNASSSSSSSSSTASAAPAPAPLTVKLLNLSSPTHRDFLFNASSERHSFEDAAALRAFMLSHARFSMSARAALAAAAAANKSYGSADKTSDLAAGFDMWSRGPSPALTQREWIDFYSAIHRTGARAYWYIARRGGGKGAAAPECCSVLAPGLVEIAKALPPQLGQKPISMPLDEAIADAVRFDADGDGVESSALLVESSNGDNDGSIGTSSALSGDNSSSNSNSNRNKDNSNVVGVNGKNAAALTHIDILEYGIMRLGTMCNALPPIQSLGH